MSAASLRSASYAEGPPLRARATALGIAVIVQILLILMLLGLATGRFKPPESSAPPMTVTELPGTQPTPAKKVAKTAKAGGRAAKAAAAKAPAAARARATPAPPGQNAFKNLLSLDHDELAATDKALAAHANAAAAGTGNAAAGQGEESASAAGVGKLPGGETLYRADWYRRPTDAEMSTYMPHRDVAGGWAEIACRTIPDFRVEDCKELDESPMGSGLSRALRQASWQFRVRPPRIGGKSMVGAWVRIHFDFYEKKQEGIG